MPHRPQSDFGTVSGRFTVGPAVHIGRVDADVREVELHLGAVLDPVRGRMDEEEASWIPIHSAEVREIGLMLRVELLGIEMSSSFVLAASRMISSIPGQALPRCSSPSCWRPLVRSANVCWPPMMWISSSRLDPDVTGRRASSCWSVSSRQASNSVRFAHAL